jgi:hypothetical protein
MATAAAMATEALIGWAERLRSGGTKFALLNAPLGSAGVTFAGGVGTIAAQTWATGARVRIGTVNIFAPSIAPLNTTTDYFLIRDSATNYRIASTAANANNGAALAPPDMAGGNYAIELAAPSTAWTIAELAAIELTHPQYDRLVVPATLPAVTFAGVIAQLDLNLAVIANSNAAPYAYNAIAIIKGGGAKGTSTGTLLDAFGLTAVSIAQNAAQSILHRLTMK